MNEASKSEQDYPTLTWTKEALRPTMRIDTPPGERVRFHGEGGYPHDRAVGHVKLVVGQEYAVKAVEIGNWVSYVYLEGVSGSFNTAMFENTPTRAEAGAGEKEEG